MLPPAGRAGQLCDAGGRGRSGTSPLLGRRRFQELPAGMYRPRCLTGGRGWWSISRPTRQNARGNTGMPRVPHLWAERLPPACAGDGAGGDGGRAMRPALCGASASRGDARLWRRAALCGGGSRAGSGNAGNSPARPLQRPVRDAVLSPVPAGKRYHTAHDGAQRRRRSWRMCGRR